MKILIIEDDKILRELLVKKLTNNGYEIEAACDGEEGFRSMQRSPPNLLLVVIICLKKAGLKLFKKCRPMKY